MILQSPQLLLNLAIQSLLSDRALAMRAIECLPGELFPPVFQEAFTRGNTELVKAMVQSWPFACLPLGALLSMTDPETMDNVEHAMQERERLVHAVMDGLDALLRHKACSRRLKLQVLDLRVVQHTFWRVWAPNNLKVRSSAAMESSRETEMTSPREVKEQPFRVMLDLWLSQEWLCPPDSYFLNWVEERKDLVRLVCRKLCVKVTHFRQVMEMLSRRNLDAVQELDVGHCWTLRTLARFAPFLGQMQNLEKLSLLDILVPALISAKRRERLFSEITHQLGKLHCLREIYMDSVQLLEGHLDCALRCLRSPLETLSLTHCWLSRSDWNQLPQIEKIRKLKHFHLSCIKLTNVSAEPLRMLLDHIAPTLVTLYLESCGITHAQLQTFLPALLCCSQLTTFSFIRNVMSTGAMRNLLRHTAGLSNLKLELYSVPLEIYVPRHGVYDQLRNEVHQELERIVRPLNHPRTILFCTFRCGHCCTHKCLKIHPGSCSACIPISPNA